MSLARLLNKLGKSLSNAGKQLINENEDSIAGDPIDNYLESNSSNSFGSGESSSIEEELKIIKKIYIRAKHSLEQKSFDSTRLTVPQSILINKADVTLGGYFEDYIFDSYSDGLIYAKGPRDRLTISPLGIVSKDPDYNPVKRVYLSDMYSSMKISCRYPVDCLKELAIQSDVLVDVDPSVLEKHIRDLEKDIS